MARRCGDGREHEKCAGGVIPDAAFHRPESSHTHRCHGMGRQDPGTALGCTDPRDFACPLVLRPSLAICFRVAIQGTSLKRKTWFNSLHHVMLVCLCVLTLQLFS